MSVVQNFYGEIAVRYQSKSAIAYFFRNFWHLVPWSVVSAVLLGMFCNNNTVIVVYHDFIAGNITAENVATTVLNYAGVLRFGQYWWGVLVALVVFSFTESLLMVKVERHMRVGEMKAFPFRRALSLTPTVFVFVLCVTAVLECLNLIVVGIAFLLQSFGVTAVLWTSAALLVLVKVLLMLLIGTLLVAFPIMILENYSFNQALSYSVRLMSEKRRFLWLLATLYPLTEIVLTVISALIDVYAVTVTLFALMYLVGIALMPSVTFKLYYDSVGGERRDISCVMFG